MLLEKNRASKRNKLRKVAQWFKAAAVGLHCRE